MDCLLCHDGARHLDTVNLWGAHQKRSDMWGLSAFFAGTQMKREIAPDPLFARFIVSDLPAGEYRLNTRTGNRTAREGAAADNDGTDGADGADKAAPRYPFLDNTADFGVKGRQSLASIITWDPQFAGPR